MLAQWMCTAGAGSFVYRLQVLLQTGGQEQRDDNLRDCLRTVPGRRGRTEQSRDLSAGATAG